ncbi:glycosyltransferase [Corallococcus sp. EGB]|uniref:glycosyltransferase n=1 Tax=Corallococcus sp. EGB TaxID=1521117 RepID=UPI001CBE5DBD|nr:glycosyltransferase [Corallococcus sp. EGB]
MAGSRADGGLGWRLPAGGHTEDAQRAAGADIHLTQLRASVNEQAVYENAVRKRPRAWIWRCHVDLSNPEPSLWEYLKPFVEQDDAMVLRIPEYERELSSPQPFFMPAIEPFSIKNREMRDSELEERLRHHEIPTALPLVVQVSRFDHWKDPEGVVAAWRIACEQTPCTPVLLGNMATDDPEGQRVYEQVMRHRDERILVLSREDTALVNALQRRAAVVVQESMREGFGLTVAEAMWKGTPVIAPSASCSCGATRSCAINWGVTPTKRCAAASRPRATWSSTWTSSTHPRPATTCRT